MHKLVHNMCGQPAAKGAGNPLANIRTLSSAFFSSTKNGTKRTLIARTSSPSCRCSGNCKQMSTLMLRTIDI